MSVRSRVADRPVPAVKAFGGSEPPAMQAAAEDVSQMGTQHPFSPGEPVGPYDGYSRTPRSQNFVTGYNIATRPRTHERVSFETLRGLIDNYDVAQIAIWHRIDSIRSLDWKLVAEEHYEGDVTDAIPVGMAALKKPDRIHFFETWLGKWLWDVLAYDAGALYRLRNRGGRCIGLLPVDGTTLAPLVDYWGNPPGAMTGPGEPLPESHVQYVNGLPWNWLTRDDLVYEPYRMHNDSLYGRAPIESIILNANTDIRFQIYFLQRFTEGNLPAAFAAAPETWSPEQIEQFQEYWDGFMYGDQSRKHQIRWMPGGTSFAWSDEKEFTDHFSLFLMRKTAAAYHVVPADLGFTENVNRSSGESQADVQHRVGDLPFVRYIQRIISSFLQDDLGLPLRFAFDLGEEQADRVQQAQADKIYVDMGAIGASDIREMRYGMAEPEGRPVPRYIFTERAGPIPLSSLFAVAGEIDAATAAPLPGAPVSHEVFGGTEGVLPNPPIKVMSLAEQEFGPSAMPPAPPPQPVLQAPQPLALPAGPVAKEGEGGAPTAGITSETGITSYDLIGRDDDEEDEPEPAAIAKEMAAFRRFERARRKAGTWRDFTFEAADPVRAHRLNDAGRLAVRKAAGEVAVAGLAVLAADTGRVLMLQRALCDDDPAAGMWEFPGGHLEQGESPLQAAWREWAEETAMVPPPGVQTGTWTAGDGIYQGIVWTVESEACVPVRSEPVVPNPDDPDGDQIESIAFWNPADLPGNPVIRPELLDSIGDVMAALGRCAPEEVAKAGGSGPKGSGPSADRRALPTRDDVADLMTVDPVLARQHSDALTLGMSPTDVSHHVVGQLDAPPDRRPAEVRGRPSDSAHQRGREFEVRATASLQHLVGGVDLVGPEEQVIRPDARRIVAPVQDKETGRDSSLGDLPGDAVRKEGDAAPRPGRGSHPEDPVVAPVRIPSGHPDPAVPALVNLGPEASDESVVNGESHQVILSKAGTSSDGGGPEWPGWKLDHKTVAHWAPQVIAAVTGALPRSRLNGIAGDYLAAHPQQQGDEPGKRERNSAAAAWLAGQGVTLPLDGLAPGIVTDGYLIGGVSAAAMVSGLNADTGGWQPGDGGKARERIGELGAVASLSALLTTSSADATAGMTGGYLDTLARVLAGAEISAEDLGLALSEALADEDLAASLVMTQITTVAGTAAQDYYMANGVGYGRWVVDPGSRSGVCPRCQGNQAAGRVPIGQPYPSGDASAPIHPHCRCCVVPDWA